LNSQLFRAALIASVVLLIAAAPVAAKPEFPDEFKESIHVKVQSIISSESDESSSLDENVELNVFKKAVTTGEADRITGLFVTGYGGYYVVQQSAGQDGMVSPVEGVLTQFLRPASNGVIGLLAHNFAAGKLFEQFQSGTLIHVIYGDGDTVLYKLTKAMRFQALNGRSSTTDFIDLSSGDRQTVDQVYQQVYAGKPHLTLQTCIETEGNWYWGRLFLLAEPVP
jgi:hypothetical protein